MTENLEQIDILVIGAGIVGAAVACELSRISNRLIWVLEKHSRVGEGVTSRNSGVIHSGLYYAPDSLKAKLCVRGNKLVYDWVKKHGVPYKQTGKLVIAVEKDEIPEIEWLFKNAMASGATGLRILTQRELWEKEPEVKGCAALFAENTGVVDQFAFTKSLFQDAESRGALVLTNTEVLRAKVNGSANGNGYRIETSRGPVIAQVVINAAGLDADRVAGMLGGEVPQIYPCRGDYFYLRPGPNLKHLIYPVKKKSAPGLGIHITLGVDGSVRLGPDFEYVKERDDFSPRPEKKAIFKIAVERYLGPLSDKSLHYDQCGIRPKLRSPQESEEKDFYIKKSSPGWIDLIGIESPGLTAALAIAEVVNKLL